MFDFTEYDKAQKSLTILRDIQNNAKVNGISRDDIKYALEAAEIFQLPARYPVNSFTAEPSSTNLAVAIESLSEGQKLGYSILTGVIVGLLAKIITHFFSGSSGSSSSGGLAPYIKMQNKTLEQLENLRKIAELEKEKADEIATVETRRKAMRKVLGDVEISEYMTQHPYTRIAFETLCSQGGKFRNCSAYLGEQHKRENLRNIYVYLIEELNDSLGDMIIVADAIKEWVYARRRGGNREKVVEPRVQVPGHVLDKFISTGTKTIFDLLASNKIVGPGMMIDVTPPEVWSGVPIPTEDIPLFTLIETFKYMHQLNGDSSGIKFAESADYLDRLITTRDTLPTKVANSNILNAWEPLPKAEAKEYDPMNLATRLNERISKDYSKAEWEKLFSEPDDKGYSSDKESDYLASTTFQMAWVYFAAVQNLYKESAILLKMANDVIAGLHDALRIVEHYHKELKAEAKDDKSEDK